MLLSHLPLLAATVLPEIRDRVFRVRITAQRILIVPNQAHWQYHFFS